MMEAAHVCEKSGRAFRTVFRKQYLLSEDGGFCPEGWTTRRLKRWHLYHCPELPVAEIRDADGRRAGWFLGVGVGQDGGLFPGGGRLPLGQGAGGFWRAAEAVIEGVAGRYAAILTDGQEERIYHDPVCDLSCVYDPVTRCVASSLLVCLQRPLERNRRMPHRGPLKGRHNYGLRQTPDRHVLRALPNHYLSLRTFTPVRHFPRGDESFEAEEGRLDETCEAIAARLQQVMAALLGNFRCVVPVTGGNDSRNLLACGGAGLRGDHAFFTHHINKMSGFDCMIGQEIGAALGLDVQIVDVLAAMKAPGFDDETLQRRRWDLAYATGYQTMGKTSAVPLAKAMAPAGDLLLRGNVMELMRANQYDKQLLDRFDLRHGLSKLVVAPEIDETAVAVWGPDYMMWSDTLPENTRARIYDFAFIEQLLPNTMGATLLGPDPQFYMNPFADRGMMCRALSLPPETRRTNRMNPAVVGACAEGLNAIPRTGAFKRDAASHATYDKMFRAG